jgi:hypothetical protein
MKFAHDYTEALCKEHYPSQWVQSAISYRHLKKCIKKVRKELLSLGLDPDTLNLLWQSRSQSRIGETGDSFVVGLCYSFSGKQ